MNSVVADNGLLCCVPLTVDDDVRPGSDADREEPLAWREGVQHQEARIAILKIARIQNVSLIDLSHHLGVKWAHFIEWAETVEEDVLRIFTDHRWHDEITCQDPEFTALRRDGLAIGDYFSNVQGRGSAPKHKVSQRHTRSSHEGHRS